MSRNTTPAPESREVQVNEVVIVEEVNAANQLALAQRETDEHARAVAKQLGYLLPADATDPDLIQRDIAANMRRSVEACLEVGKGLAVLKAACPHGNFLARLEVLGVDRKVAAKFMQSAAKFANVSSTRHLTEAIGNQTKLFEMLVLDDEQIEELEQDGHTGGLSIDDVATMSVKELRAAVREAKAEKEANKKLLENKNKQIDKLEREKHLIATVEPIAALAALRQEATDHLSATQGMVTGRLRAALQALKDAPDAEGKSLFMAGMVGQLMADLVALRDEFNLSNVVGDGRPEWQQWADKQAAAGAAAN